MFDQSFRKRIIRNFIDVLILLEIQKHPLTGYGVMTYLQKKFAVSLSSGTVYGVLYAMERKGLIESFFDGRTRLFQPSPKGLNEATVLVKAHKPLQNLLRETEQAAAEYGHLSREAKDFCFSEKNESDGKIVFERHDSQEFSRELCKIDSDNNRVLHKIPASSNENKVVSGEKSFNQLFLIAVDESFSFLGEPAKEAIYYQLEKTFGIERSDIPIEIDKFSNALERIIGLGSVYLKILIMKNLYAQIRINVDSYFPEFVGNANFNFEEYVKSVKMNLNSVNK